MTQQQYFLNISVKEREILHWRTLNCHPLHCSLFVFSTSFESFENICILYPSEMMPSTQFAITVTSSIPLSLGKISLRFVLSLEITGVVILCKLYLKVMSHYFFLLGPSSQKLFLHRLSRHLLCYAKDSKGHFVVVVLHSIVMEEVLTLRAHLTSCPFCALVHTFFVCSLYSEEKWSLE